MYFIGSSDSEDEPDCVPSCNSSLIDHQSVLVSEESVMEPPAHSTCQGKEDLQSYNYYCYLVESESMNLEAQSSSVSFDHDVHFFSLTSENIEEYILKQVKRKLENGLSQSVSEGILSDLASLLDNDLIPTKWSEVMKLLRKLGYSNPRHFKVCCGSDHSILLRDEITNWFTM